MAEKYLGRFFVNHLKGLFRTERDIRNRRLPSEPESPKESAWIEEDPLYHFQSLDRMTEASRRYYNATRDISSLERIAKQTGQSQSVAIDKLRSSTIADKADFVRALRVWADELEQRLEVFSND